jgi:GNAT superfamily N-acetyltransferase/predicted nucleic acid-binding protein
MKRTGQATPNTVVLSTKGEVRPFIEAARTNADQDKMALGFLPAGAYEEAASRGNLLVAICDGSYAGHLLFGGSYPSLKVFQLYVSESLRRCGIGTALVSGLVNLANHHGYLSITANVAEDLAANAFWERAGFVLLRSKPGGASRNRIINVRVRELDTPTLFKTSSATLPELGIVPNYSVQLPVYVLDLNVFWDVVQRRPRREFAAQVLAAAFDNLIKVLVTQEFINELERTSKVANDPALEFALQLPVLPLPPIPVSDTLVSEIASILFPERVANGKVSAHDRSDLIHLATAIHHEATGFVTSEHALVKKRDLIYEKFGVDVLHVKDLATGIESCRRDTPVLQTFLSGETVRVWNLIPGPSDYVEGFIAKLSPNEATRQELMSLRTHRNQKSLIVTSDEEIVSLAFWDGNAGLSNRVNLRLLTDGEHPAAEAALDCLFDQVARDASAIAPVVLSLTTRTGDVTITKVALSHGFEKQGGEQLHACFNKICVGRPISPSNFKRLGTALQLCSGIRFPDILPEFKSVHQKITFYDASDRERSLELASLEKYLSPTLLLCPNRPGVIAPIQRVFADDLFGTSRQLSLLPSKEAVMCSERVYFSAARNRVVLQEGRILIFYESGKDNGRSAAIAAARVLATEVVEKRSVSSTLLRKGVLEESQIAALSSTEQIAVTRFDNVLVFSDPVPLAMLRELECVDGANLVTARTLSANRVTALLEAAFNES